MRRCGHGEGHRTHVQEGGDIVDLILDDHPARPASKRKRGRGDVSAQHPPPATHPHALPRVMFLHFLQRPAHDGRVVGRVVQEVQKHKEQSRQPI